METKILNQQTDLNEELDAWEEEQENDLNNVDIVDDEDEELNKWKEENI